jgi:aerobic C4-dicarboxylate transport protein
LAQQLGLLLLLLITSKGSGSVAGSGFVVLAATLSATHVLPVEGLALLIGIDRFMSEARSVTNIIGNGVATVVVSKLSAEFDPVQADAAYAERFGAGVKFNLKPVVVSADEDPVSATPMMSPQPD